eukprot:7573671-Heterocapsa_arctica.AAC.1
MEGARELVPLVEVLLSLVRANFRIGGDSDLVVAVLLADHTVVIGHRVDNEGQETSRGAAYRYLDEDRRGIRSVNAQAVSRLQSLRDDDVAIAAPKERELEWEVVEPF